MSEQEKIKAQLEQLYQSLVDVVRHSMSEGIDPKSIRSILEKVTDTFAKDLYNELLLLFYTNSKDNYIYGHIANNVILSVGFATSLGVARQDIDDIALCAFAHDFGMMDYLDLFQKAAALNANENKSIHGHLQRSVDIFKAHFPERVLEGIMDVHECVNGKGYPQGKTGSEISFLAKIVSICDIFEALTHPRNFRPEFTPYAALKMIIKKKDVIFEKKVVKKFVEFMSIYPVGSLVHLNTGEVGIVIAGNPQFPTRSVVRVLLNAQKEAQPTERVIDLLNDPMLYIASSVNPKEEKEVLTALSGNGR